MPYKPFRAADEHPGLAARQCVGGQFPRRLVERPAVEQLDVAGGMGQQQFDRLGLGRVVRVVDEPPEAGLPQAGLLVLAGSLSAARTALPRSGSRRRRGTPRSAGRIDSRRGFRGPRPRRATRRPAAAARAGRRSGWRLRAGSRCRREPADPRSTGMFRAAVTLARSAAAATARSPEQAGDGAFVRGHDSSVMSRYSAYSANQVMATTAATSRISKNSTTAASLVGGLARCFLGAARWPDSLVGACRAALRRQARPDVQTRLLVGACRAAFVVRRP